MNSSTATAQMFRPVKETSQIHNCKIVVEGFFWPISPTRINGKSSTTIINKNTIYFVLIYHTLNTCFVPPEHLHQVVCEEDHQSMDCSHCYHQADVITEPSLADCKTSPQTSRLNWTRTINRTQHTNLICTALYHLHWLDSVSLLFSTLTFCLH